MKNATYPYIEFRGLIERLGPSFGYTRGFDYGSIQMLPGLNIDKINHKLKFMIKHTNLLKVKEFDDILSKMAAYEIPGFTIAAASSIAATTATIAGTILMNNNLIVTELGFVLSTVTNPTIANTKIVKSKDSFILTHNLTGLVASTPYYVKVFVTTKFDTYYSSQITFTTTV